MKTILAFLMILISYLGMTQNQSVEKDENHYYSLGTDLMVQEFDFIANIPKSGGKKIIGKKGASLNLVKVIEDNNGAILHYVVKFWSYSNLHKNYDEEIELLDEEIAIIDNELSNEDDDDKKDKLNVKKDKLTSKKEVLDADKTKYLSQEATYVSNDDNGIYFFIKAKDFTEPHVLKTYYRGRYNLLPNIGTLIVPVKIRPSFGDRPFDFTTDFTLGTSIGIKTRVSKFRPNYLSLVGVFGITTVNIDNNTTNGFVSEATKQSALTPAIGLVMEIEGFQIGLIAGKDFIGGNTGKSWIYNKRTWWSFGIGYEFVKEKESK